MLTTLSEYINVLTDARASSAASFPFRVETRLINRLSVIQLVFLGSASLHHRFREMSWNSTALHHDGPHGQQTTQHACPSSPHGGELLDSRQFHFGAVFLYSSRFS